ncbi:MAG: molybdenum cofactor guanylyltransferase MobA [Sulfurovum sp.]|nr:molybdenum cofactor guanylyltransferase MobA [Sulfurovum sp.]
MKEQNIPAVIFAGGKSSRMGEDKALLPFGGESSLARWQYDRMQEIFTDVYISTKEAKFDFDAPLILDRYPEHSPLAGIVSVLEYLDNAKRVFIISVDTPFIDASVIKKLIQTDTQKSIVVARTEGKVHPLCGVYDKDFLPFAKAAMAQGKHKLVSLIEETDSGYADFPQSKAFMNLNHPHEYEEAKRVMSS